MMTTWVPSGLNASENPQSRSPPRATKLGGVFCKSQIRAGEPFDVVTTLFPSGLNAAETTSP